MSNGRKSHGSSLQYGSEEQPCGVRLRHHGQPDPPQGGEGAAAVPVTTAGGCPARLPVAVGTGQGHHEPRP